MTSSLKELPRAERRRILRDPMYQNKVLAGSEGVPPYYRMMAYGQVLVAQMVETQQRLLGVGHARARRPKGAREALQEQLTLLWEELTEKLEGVQKEMAFLEGQENVKEINRNPAREVEIYGLC